MLNNYISFGTTPKSKQHPPNPLDDQKRRRPCFSTGLYHPFFGGADSRTGIPARRGLSKADLLHQKHSVLRNEETAEAFCNTECGKRQCFWCLVLRVVFFFSCFSCDFMHESMEGTSLQGWAAGSQYQKHSAVRNDVNRRSFLASLLRDPRTLPEILGSAPCPHPFF